MTICQNYPPVFEDLTTVEETLFARCHPVSTILKLRPGGHTSPANYNALQGRSRRNLDHSFAFSPVLSFKTRQHDQSILAGERLSDTERSEALPTGSKGQALEFLVEYNPLYRDLQTNYPMIESWADHFIHPTRDRG